MADVVRLRDYAPKVRESAAPEGPCAIIILPVVRIERHPEPPTEQYRVPFGRKRKRKKEA